MIPAEPAEGIRSRQNKGRKNDKGSRFVCISSRQLSIDDGLLVSSENLPSWYVALCPGNNHGIASHGCGLKVVGYETSKKNSDH